MPSKNPSVNLDRRDVDRCQSLVRTNLTPNLSIVIFKRKGWTEEDYARWSQELLEAGEGFVMPTKYQGETVLRFCIVNPTTTEDDITLVLDTLAPEVQ